MTITRSRVFRQRPMRTANRAAQLRASAARSREAKRQAGLRPHEHWYRDDEAAAVAGFFRVLVAARAPAPRSNAPA